MSAPRLSVDDAAPSGVPPSLLSGTDLNAPGSPAADGFAYTDSIAWSAQTDISASDIVEKQRLIKDIMDMQVGLNGLMQRITSVKGDCTKAEADNEMLQVYIDSVTKSLAAKS